MVCITFLSIISCSCCPITGNSLTTCVREKVRLLKSFEFLRKWIFVFNQNNPINGHYIYNTLVLRLTTVFWKVLRKSGMMLIRSRT